MKEYLYNLEEGKDFLNKTQSLVEIQIINHKHKTLIN